METVDKYSVDMDGESGKGSLSAVSEHKSGF